jgi:hypothetical protein
MGDEEQRGLNQCELSSLAITLRRMEQLVQRSRALRNLVREGGSGGILLNQVARLNEQQLARLEELELATAAQLAQARAAFGLEIQREDARHSLYSAFSRLWADLEDTRPQKLIRFGPIAPAASSQLAPLIDRLLELNQAFIRTLGKEPDEDSSRNR